MKGTLRPCSYLNFPLVKVTVKEIAYKFKSLKNPKSTGLVEKSGDEISIFVTQRYRKCIKNVPIGPEHLNK